MLPIQQIVLRAAALCAAGPSALTSEANLVEVQESILRVQFLDEFGEVGEDVYVACVRFLRSVVERMTRDRHDLSQGFVSPPTIQDLMSDLQRNNIPFGVVVGEEDEDDVGVYAEPVPIRQFFYPDGNLLTFNAMMPVERSSFWSCNQVDVVEAMPWMSSVNRQRLTKAGVDPSSRYWTLESTCARNACFLFHLRVAIEGSLMGFDRIPTYIKLDWVTASTNSPVIVRTLRASDSIVEDGRDHRRFLMTRYPLDELRWMFENNGFYLIFVIHGPASRDVQGNYWYDGYWVRLFPSLSMDFPHTQLYAEMIWARNDERRVLEEVAEQHPMWNIQQDASRDLVEARMRGFHYQEERRDEYLSALVGPRVLFI